MTDTQDSTIRLHTPLGEADARGLRIGDRVLLSGVVYTARDAAHQRLAQAIASGQDLPFSLEGQVIYYVGPSPARPGAVIGSAGPTTSTRMDAYTPQLLARGLRGTIGKGFRSQAVRVALAQYGAVYFVSVGGAAALAADRIRAVEMVAFDDLGTEAIRRLVIDEFPVTVANDAHGGDLFESGRAAYRREAAA
jgi:fumarate hydratase subunit beta